VAAWAKVEQGDLRAIETVLRIMDRRARLLGLFPAKKRLHRSTSASFDPASWQRGRQLAVAQIPLTRGSLERTICASC